VLAGNQIDFAHVLKPSSPAHMAINKNIFNFFARHYFWLRIAYGGGVSFPWLKHHTFVALPTS